MPDLDITKISDDDVKIGALADGFANSAVNGTDVDDGSTALAGVGNEINTNTTANTSTSDDDVSNSGNGNSDNDFNGNNRGNEYDLNYTSKIINATHTDTDVDIKDNGNTSHSNNVLDSNNDYDWTSNKSYADNDVKNTTHNETEDSYNSSSSNTSNSHNTAISDDDFGSLKDVGNFGNLGVAGHDVTYDIGDDFSFHFNVDNILNNALGGDGNDAGFSLVQANNLADQDTA